MDAAAFTIDLTSQSVSAASAICSDSFNAALCDNGIVLLRGALGVSPQELAKAAEGILGLPFQYRFFVTPRRQLDAGFMTATDAPPVRTIRFHSECSYLPCMPRYLLFICQTASLDGGRTLVASTANVAKALPRSLLEEFGERFVQYRWALPSASEVVRKLAARNIDEARLVLEQLGAQVREQAGRFIVRTVRPAIGRQRSGTPIWVNHVWALHRSAVPDSLVQLYQRQYGPGLMPHHVVFDDGDEIANMDVEQIGRAYSSHSVPIGWRAGDILVLDNLLWAHAREAYRGSRDLRVQMYGRVSVV